MNGGGTGCPWWCDAEHDETVHRDDEWHRQAPAVVRITRWRRIVGGTDEPIEWRESYPEWQIGLVRPFGGGEDRVRIEGIGGGPVDLDLESARRLARSLVSVLGSAAADADEGSDASVGDARRVGREQLGELQVEHLAQREQGAQRGVRR